MEQCVYFSGRTKASKAVHIYNQIKGVRVTRQKNFNVGKVDRISLIRIYDEKDSSRTTLECCPRKSTLFKLTNVLVPSIDSNFSLVMMSWNMVPTSKRVDAISTNFQLHAKKDTIFPL